MSTFLQLSVFYQIATSGMIKSNVMHTRPLSSYVFDVSLFIFTNEIQGKILVIQFSFVGEYALSLLQIECPELESKMT